MKYILTIHSNCVNYSKGNRTRVCIFNSINAAIKHVDTYIDGLTYYGEQIFCDGQEDSNNLADCEYFRSVIMQDNEYRYNLEFCIHAIKNFNDIKYER